VAFVNCQVQKILPIRVAIEHKRRYNRLERNKKNLVSRAFDLVFPDPFLSSSLVSASCTSACISDEKDMVGGQPVGAKLL
jgi:hypothetical protein